MKFILLSISLLGALSGSLTFGSSAHASLSAHRPSHVPFELYLRAAQVTAIANGHFGERGPAVFEKKKFSEAAWDRVPLLSAQDLQTSFEIVRDEKVFEDVLGSRKFRRRATWLYPDDGCFVRAAVAADMIQSLTSVMAAKIFAFGNLNVKTENSPSGEVSWWYHVAAIAKVNESGVDTFYVYDPAMQTKKPIEVTAWLKAMGSPDAEIAICSGDAYDPDSDCASGHADPLRRAKSEAPTYLQAEWYRLDSLGRDPSRELGDFPPWL